MPKLWDKGITLNETIEAFETKGDLIVDQKLIQADVAGSLAHAMQLTTLGILTPNELAVTKTGLQKILTLQATGKFTLEFGDEDIHTKIEHYLTKHYGDVGKKIHTGRSRNDQIATAIRLFTKDELIDIGLSVIDLTQTFIAFAQTYEWLPMPGYTHMQKAMPSSVGMWAASFVQSLLDDLVILQGALTIVDQSPLGSAAGYGVPMPLDRTMTAKLLGFAKVQKISLASQNSRGKMETVVINALLQIMLTINKFASDVLLFTTTEFGFFTAADELTTGSSIMPQKKNVDVAELLRSKTHLILGHLVSVASLTTNLPSGYNRDYQDLKKSLIESLTETHTSLTVTKILLTNLTPNKKKLMAAMTPELFATHSVLKKVTAGIPFRDAYSKTAQELTTLTKRTENEILSSLQESVHIGGTGNLGLKQLSTATTKEKTHMEKALHLEEVIQKLL